MEDNVICRLDDPNVVQEVWNKGIVIDGYDSDLYRQDFAGAWISRNAYGDADSIFGWEIDHVYPQSRGGLNHFINLRPMNIRNNRSKSDDYPRYQHVVTAEENRNVEQTGFCTVGVVLQSKLKELYNL